MWSIHKEYLQAKKKCKPSELETSALRRNHPLRSSIGYSSHEVLTISHSTYECKWVRRVLSQRGSHPPERCCPARWRVCAALPGEGWHCAGTRILSMGFVSSAEELGHSFAAEDKVLLVKRSWDRGSFNQSMGKKSFAVRDAGMCWIEEAGGITDG